MATIQTLQSGISSDKFFKIINENFRILEESSYYTELTSNSIQDGAITTEKIADNAITTEKIATGAITKTQIANNAVTTEKIVDSSITMEKLDQNIQTILANSKRTFLVSNIPTNTQIKDIYGQTYTAQPGDILIRVTGINGG